MMRTSKIITKSSINTDKLLAAINESKDYTQIQLFKDGLPEGIDAVRVDITVHNPHGWHPTVVGRIATLEEGIKFDLEGDEVKES